MKIEIGDREYNVTVVTSEEDKAKGLQGITELAPDEGMLFIYDEPQTIGFWMKDTEIPLDIIFINEDQEVISIYEGEPNDETIAEEDNVMYVLEVNQGSGIEEGDDLDIEDEEDDEDIKMQVIGPDGESQMELSGGERIFSRKNTKTLVRMAKRAYKSKAEKDYKALGKKAFKYLDTQDSNKPEYVES